MQYSLWAAGVIEFVGALVLLFVYSAISKGGAGTTNQDAVNEELGSSLFGGEIAETILNAIFGPGTLLVVGAIVFAIALYVGRASDEKFQMHQRYPRVADTSDVSKYQRLVDVVILILTIIHALPALAVSIGLIPEIVNGGVPAPGDPWYMSRYGSLLAASFSVPTPPLGSLQQSLCCCEAVGVPCALLFLSIYRGYCDDG